MELETQENPPLLHVKDYRANVDSSRPFRSVKEAVAIFGERLLLGEMFSSPLVQTTTTPPSSSSWKTMSPPPSYKEREKSIDSNDGDDHEENINYARHHHDDDKFVLDTLKKLEAELEETKVELKLLKERESETEVALASLNAELHKNMSKLAQAEAAAAAKASNVLHVATRSPANTNNGNLMVREEEKNKREWMIRMEGSTSLAQILSIGTENYYGGGKREKNKKTQTMMMKKQKPIVPLVQDLFFWKKGSSDTLRNHLYSSSPQLYY